jgi:hypothetical protein
LPAASLFLNRLQLVIAKTAIDKMNIFFMV